MNQPDEQRRSIERAFQAGYQRGENAGKLQARALFQAQVKALNATVLAQTKIFFTVAVLQLREMLPRLGRAQLAGLLLLFAGAVLVALKDVATGVAAAGGNRALGIGTLLCGQACTSFANVAYEARRRAAPAQRQRSASAAPAQRQRSPSSARGARGVLLASLRLGGAARMPRLAFGPGRRER